jgi:hypothetical protein
MKNSSSTTLVYSTETCRICPIAVSRWRSVKQLKAACGSCGTVKDGVIEVQATMWWC